MGKMCVSYKETFYKHPVYFSHKLHIPLPKEMEKKA